jgi:hypothetical protein
MSSKLKKFIYGPTGVTDLWRPFLWNKRDGCRRIAEPHGQASEKPAMLRQGEISLHSATVQELEIRSLPKIQAG